MRTRRRSRTQHAYKSIPGVEITALEIPEYSKYDDPPTSLINESAIRYIFSTFPDDATIKEEIPEKLVPFDNTPIARNDLLTAEIIHGGGGGGGGELDVMFLPVWKRYVFRFLPFSSLFSASLSGWAGWVQYGILLEMYEAGAIPYPLVVLFGIYFGAGLLLSVPKSVIGLLQASACLGEWRPRLTLVGSEVPSVDVLVTVCREPLDVVQDTIYAALALDYPSHRYRVVVCDDGDSEALAAWVALKASRRPNNLHYTSRTRRRGPEGYKAGNLNHGLKLVDALPGGAAEYVAGIDADMIVERRWLRSVVAHIAPDPDMGMACPAQNFYNVPINDPLSQSMRYSWRLSNVIRDMADVAWNTGSGWVVRRAAIDEIGGFPTDCLTEDIYSSALLLTLGWKTAYLPEALQYGLVPETYAAHVKQLTRWNDGGCQLAFLMRFFCSRSRTKSLTLRQRAPDVAQAVANVFGPCTSLAGLMLTVLFLFSDIQLVYFTTVDQLRLLLRLQAGVVLWQTVPTCLSAFLVGYETAIRLPVSWMDPFSMMRSFVLPSVLGGRKASFTPSGTVPDHTHERDARCPRPPLHRRLWHMMVHCGVWFHVLVVTLLAAGVACRVAGHPLISIINYKGLTSEAEEAAVWMIGLLERVAWPPLSWLALIVSWATPIRYALYPPRVPDRRSCWQPRMTCGVIPMQGIP
ncbi:nucleotide-diphospho-sugar transferase [Xylariomycetidae sp. FL2044]|nr:nucleotide-diphospho-sugar transferase [Xylariomycetidae sp. FL2044]